MGAFVYMLRCSDESYYVGSATGDDLTKRLAEHETGAYAGYTSSQAGDASVVRALRANRRCDKCRTADQGVEPRQERGAHQRRLEFDSGPLAKARWPAESGLRLHRGRRPSRLGAHGAEHLRVTDRRCTQASTRHPEVRAKRASNDDGREPVQGTFTSHPPSPFPPPFPRSSSSASWCCPT